MRDGEAFVVPVSAAYALAGELRTTWEGLTGGDAPTRVLDAFVDQAGRVLEAMTLGTEGHCLENEREAR